MVLLYQIAKSLHIISMVAWMAGLLYLYRLFVYHAEETESVVKTRFQIMEKRLYWVITVPAMVLTLIFGTTLIVLMPAYLHMTWIYIKLGCVLGLVGMTMVGATQIQDLAAGHVPYRAKTYRILNEVPTLLLVIIVFLVVMKPF